METCTLLALKTLSRVLTGAFHLYCSSLTKPRVYSATLSLCLLRLRPVSECFPPRNVFKITLLVLQRLTRLRIRKSDIFESKAEVLGSENWPELTADKILSRFVQCFLAVLFCCNAKLASQWHISGCFIFLPCLLDLEIPLMCLRSEHMF